MKAGLKTGSDLEMISCSDNGEGYVLPAQGAELVETYSES